MSRLAAHFLLSLFAVTFLCCMVPASLAYESRAGTAGYEIVGSEPAVPERIRAARELLNEWAGEPGILPRAEALLDAELAAGTADYLANYELARYAVMSGDLGGNRGALMLIDKVLAEQPDYSDAFVLKGHVLTNLGLAEEAYAALGEATRLNNSSPWLPLNRAQLAIDAGMFKIAFDLCEGVIRLRSTDAKVIAAAYQCSRHYLEQQRDWEAVERSHKAVLALSPDRPWSLVNYADFLCLDRARCPEAMDLIAKARARANFGAMDYVEAAALYDRWARIAATQGVRSASAEAAFAKAQAMLPDLNYAMAHFGGSFDNQPMVSALLAKGANVDHVDEEGITALIRASVRGDAVAVKVLLGHGAEVNLAPDEFSALMAAARGGFLDVVKVLADAGADGRSEPETAMRLARVRMHPEVADYLGARFALN